MKIDTFQIRETLRRYNEREKYRRRSMIEHGRFSRARIRGVTIG
jgi:hypothetical protein